MAILRSIRGVGKVLNEDPVNCLRFGKVGIRTDFFVEDYCIKCGYACKFVRER